MRNVVLLVPMLAGFAFAGPGGQPPIKIGPIAVVAQEDIGTCNNVWALDSFNKFYTITINHDRTWNVKVQYKDGTFVTQAGISPGACIGGNTNGNTVSAGVLGKTHQEYNRTVIGTLIPDFSCGPNNANCYDTTSILNTLFGVGQWAWKDSDWSWEGHYEAGPNGTWFDTSTNWPYNDRGDITGQ